MVQRSTLRMESAPIGLVGSYQRFTMRADSEMTNYAYFWHSRHKVIAKNIFELKLWYQKIPSSYAYAARRNVVSLYPCKHTISITIAVARVPGYQKMYPGIGVAGYANPGAEGTSVPEKISWDYLGRFHSSSYLASVAQRIGTRPLRPDLRCPVRYRWVPFSLYHHWHQMGSGGCN
eukprot:3613673-Rhodomonas_salina.2